MILRSGHFPLGHFPGMFPDGHWPKPPAESEISTAAYIEQALYEHILGTSAVVSLICDRLYPLFLPQGQTADSIIYQQIYSGGDRLTTGGTLGIIDIRFQFTILAATHKMCLRIASDLTSCLTGINKTIGQIKIHASRIINKGDIPFIDQDAEQLNRSGKFLDCLFSYSIES